MLCLECEKQLNGLGFRNIFSGNLNIAFNVGYVWFSAQVTLIDPQWGREDRLWAVLATFTGSMA